MKDTKILIVEDERLTSRAVQGFLQSRGYAVVGMATSGEEAIAKAGDLHPDLVLMDISLEGPMDGVVAAGEIRDRYSIPIVYLTANMDERTWQRAMDSEPYGHVLKPIDVNTLYSAIEMALYRHALDRRLKKSEERYRRITDNMQDMVSLVDTDGMILYVSPTHTTVLGYQPEELLGATIFEFLHPEDLEEAQSIFRSELSSLAKTRVEFRARHAKGHYLWLEALGNLMLDEQNQVIAVVLGCRDITERKNTEEELRGSEERYRSLVENISDVIYTLDTQGKILYISPAVERLSKYKAEDLLNRSFTDFIHPDDLPGLLESYERTIQGRYESSEFRIFDNDGSVRYVRTSSRLIKKGEEVLGLTAVMSDITESKLAEEALRVSEERYRMVVESQTELICRFRKDYSLTFVNHAFCRYFQREKDTLIGSSFIPFIQKEDTDVVLSHLSSIGKDNTVAAVEARVAVPGGETRWVNWTTQAILNEPEGVIEMQSVGRDITDSKMLESKLKYMSMHDSLTGLYNRAYFDEEMKRLESSRSMPVGVVVGDINGLKIVNDTLGHQRGDELIRVAGDILRGCFRESDMVARIGGDEFAVLLPNATGEVTARSCERIGRSLKAFNQAHGKLPISLAVGYAVRTGFNQKLEAVFTSADDRMYAEKERMSDMTHQMVLDALMKEIHEINDYYAAHMARVKTLAVAIGSACGLLGEQLSVLRMAAEYHDIGMIGLDHTLLSKKSELTPGEYIELKKHVEIGSRIAMGHPSLRDSADIILKHHEWWNGGGYPLGLKGDKIPVESRIIAVAEVYDYMTNDWHYRKALSKRDSLKEIKRAAGMQFDPHLVEVLQAMAI